ncbi:hypothetical protein SUNI508_12237 [Seiridium unicorne]|uniref:Cyclochlorotine biosynthesis protein O n=1 Tax=Seiridium unicorne TaxID=138068 RepID=A0ABR2UEG9_9PEZI
MWPKQGTLYQSLPQLETSSQKKSPNSRPIYDRLWSRLSGNSTAILICTNFFTLFCLAASIWGPHRQETSPRACLRQFSTPSPALEAVQYLDPQLYHADFRQTNKWRAKPGVHSDDVDVAWHYIELGAGGIRITEEEMLVLNKTALPEGPWHKVPEEQGGGYLAMLEVFHLLHCLNTLRMGLWYNYDKYYKQYDEGVHEENIFTHFVLTSVPDHCIDMLRMSLMCTADVTPALFYDPLDKPQRRDALPDWSSQHTCRNFDSILEWNMEGPRSIRWRDAGTNPVWDPSLEGADPPFPPETEDDTHHHHS